MRCFRFNHSLDQISSVIQTLIELCLFLALQVQRDPGTATMRTHLSLTQVVGAALTIGCGLTWTVRLFLLDTFAGRQPHPQKTNYMNYGSYNNKDCWTNPGT